MPTTRFRKQTSTPVGDSLATSSPQRKTRQGAKLEPKHGKHDNEDSNEEEEEQAEAPRQLYTFDGIQYETYQEMVNAKRKRNQQVLEDLGFADNSSLKLSAAINKAKAAATHRGIQGKRQKIEPIRRRKSTRLSGKQSDLIALDYSSPNWNTDNSVIKVTEGAAGDEEIEEEKPSFFKGRVNDGEELSLEEAIELNGPKWISDDSAELARSFQKEVFKLETLEPRARNKSPKSIDTKIQDLSIDNEEWVAKVTPDRIYSVTCHPSESKMIACAGDKLGYVGLWDVDALKTESNNGVHLFHVHSRPVCCLEWVTSDTMVSASYDGTVRKLNVETGTFQQIFATYDDNSYYAEELGYGLDQGYNYWLQYATTDPRYQGSSPSLFMSTSAGTAMHVDLRASETQGITFNERLSEKKINSLSLHPDGYIMASAGLDKTVNLWDIRNFGSRKAKQALKPVASQFVGRSVNSALFSPSGTSLLTTSMADRLDLLENAHHQSGTMQPTKSIRHNNQTGRWLTTLMAKWHPQLDIFVSGSMAQPRCVESFDSKGKLLRAVTGESLSSVMSRCCYHPSTQKIAMIGGNSSGRVVVVR